MERDLPTLRRRGQIAGADDGGRGGGRPKRCDAQLTGGGKTDAGSYAVTSRPGGGRAFNYTLTNPSGALLIQKAPVVFTVTDSILAFDGTAKARRSDGGPGRAAYRLLQERRRENVAAPTAAGSYEIWAAITDSTTATPIPPAAEPEDRRAHHLSNYAAREIRGLPSPPAKRWPSAAPLRWTRPRRDAARAPGVRLARTGWSFTGWELDGRLYQPSQTVEQPARS